MKSLLFVFILSFPLYGFGQDKLDYSSKFLSFSYYDTYILDSSRYYMDSSNKTVKLSCKSSQYGSLQNIIISNIPIKGSEKINTFVLFSELKKDTELKMLKMGVKSNFSLLKIGTEFINNRDIPFIITKTDTENLGDTFQKLYIYETLNSSYMIISTSDNEKNLLESQKSIDLILKTFRIKQ